MPVPVVVVLEEVDVAEDEGQGGALAGGAAPLVLQDLVEAASVGEPGQGVEGGEALELGVRLRELPADPGELLVLALDLGGVSLETLEVGVEVLEVVAGAAGDGLHHGHEGGGARGDVLAEPLLRDLGEQGGGERVDGGGTDLRLDEGHLAVVAPGPSLGDLLLALAHPHPAGQDDVHGPAGVALVEQDLARLEAHLAAVAGQALQGVLGEEAKEVRSLGAGRAFSATCKRNRA